MRSGEGSGSHGQGSRLTRLRNSTRTRAGTTAPPARLPAPFRSQIGLVWGSQAQPQPHGQPMEHGRGRWQQIPFLVAAGMRQPRPCSGTIQPCGIYSPSSPWRHLRSEVPTTAPFPWFRSLGTIQSSEWIFIPPWLEHVKPISRAGVCKHPCARCWAACPPSPQRPRSVPAPRPSCRPGSSLWGASACPFGEHAAPLQTARAALPVPGGDPPAPSLSPIPLPSPLLDFSGACCLSAHNRANPAKL